MSCTVCQHPKRQEIDQALIAGSATLTSLSQEHGLSTSALHRHKAHLQANVNEAKDRLLDNVRQGCLFWLTQALEMIMQTALAAQADSNGKLVLRALAQGTRLITIILKNNLPLDDRIVFELLSSPQWAAQSGLLPHDPNIMALGRQSLAGIFTSPCPDGAPPSPTPPDLDPDALPAVLSAPAPRGAKTVNRAQPTNNDPFNKWEKSGKLPENDCYVFDKDEEYRLVELEKKIAQLDLDAITQGLPPAAANEKIEALLDQLWDAIPLPQDKELSEYLPEEILKTEPEPHHGQNVVTAKP